MDGRLRDKNEQTIAKVLQLVQKQKCIQIQRTEHELAQHKSLLTSSSQQDFQSTGVSGERQSISDNHNTGLQRLGLVKFIERDESGGGGSGVSMGMSDEESSDVGSESISLIKKDESSKGDKHAAGEELFRRMAGESWPGAKFNPPKSPSLFKVMLFNLGSWKIIISIIILVISVGFQVAQPALMKEVIKTVMKKSTSASEPHISTEVRFHYASAIILMLCPFLNGILDTLSNRFIIHISSQIRSGLASLIYNKILLLNISTQSIIDKGRLLSLLNTDTNQIAVNISSLFYMFVVPLQILVPFGFICYDWGWSALISIGVFLLTFPFQGLVYPLMRSSIKGGLEKAFEKRISAARELQLSDIFYFTLANQLLMAIMRLTPYVVNASTMTVYISTHNVPQLQFPVLVMPTMGFIIMMMMPMSQITYFIQSVFNVLISVDRIRDFLLLPELKIEPNVAPNDKQNAVDFDQCSFAYGDPPQIPLDSKEKDAIKKMAAKKKKEANLQKNHDNIQLINQDQKLSIENSDNTHSNKNINNSANNKKTTSDLETNPTVIQIPLQQIQQISQSNQLDENEQIDKNKNKQPALKDITFKLPKGSLTMIIGSVGSEKSSIGSALIGDIEKQNGTVHIVGTIAYCPQTAWINNNTIRGNITFGQEYNQDKYNEVIRVCALEPDFDSLAAGDMTAIGEKGVNLSGGQKARIQLARAVYSDRDIYILDDPLSAVDAHVGRTLFEECIDGYLKGKTRLLITNQLQFIEKADNIILLKQGRITAQGTSVQLKEQGINFDEFTITNQNIDNNQHNKKQSEQKDEKLNKQNKKIQQQTNAAKKIMTEEEQETGSISWSSYFKYILQLCPWWGIAPFFLLTLVLEGIIIYQSWFIGAVGDTVQYASLSYYWKIGIYSFFCLGELIFLIIRGVVSSFAVKRSTRLIHHGLLKHVLKTPSSFFDTTPMGRILNRFIGDITVTDLRLFMQFIIVLTMWIMLIGQIIIITIDTVWFLAIGIPALFLYGRAARNLQRLEAISRSPVMSHFSETVTGAGLSTIRAYNLAQTYIRKFEELNDRWSVRYIIFSEGKKWATLWASFISSLFMIGVIVIGWNSMNASKLAVAISASMQFASLGIQILEQQIDLQSRMTSYDRIRFYSSNLPQEVKRSNIDPVDPDNHWPSKGQIQFDNVTFRYRSGLPFVLKDVSFDLKGGEKIGVCGRTGAGKSSLLFVLFRLVELDPKLQPKMIDLTTGFLVENDPNEEPNNGRILIDGIDISKVDLSKVRKSIAIIPQDPTLFTGTLRYNLDIEGKYQNDDNRLWEVLGMVELRDIVAQLPLGLDTQVAEGGSNFSGGQRQLICFGRAILNNCRIVVMDEATASVDVETDAKIQKTIREQFVDQTVFVIAHRLNTIMTSDRIMVIQDGCISEIDTPENLKSNPESEFNALIRSLEYDQDE
ncbi:MAG: ABC transporter: Multidrug resistance-associated protein, ATP binding protein [Streblomastix strix]|uniref:ABC transporter: Multidrug resistance-associated protein, ATP binding protein n=1 Tax=Streblomastix strix TaxID=222440 RepID=A0A5J4W954_9EUKA|nr:MAG: ABC transporter: Multidrug resistance-associated protein, ATP binding protein [Streblomastix strix]